MSTNFGVLTTENKLVCEINDHGVSLFYNDELEYAEGFVFSLYSEAFQTVVDVEVTIYLRVLLLVLFFFFFYLITPKEEARFRVS